MGAINEILPKATGVGKVYPTSSSPGEVFNLYDGDSANVASGIYSHAEGAGTTATGNYSHAEGSDTTAEGNCSHAEGVGTTATGNYSHAEGHYTKAIGRHSHAEGAGTASGGHSHAEGSNTNASGECSHAEGDNTNASGECSHAEGCGTNASGECSHAEGYYTTASGERSHAEGDNTQTFSLGEHAEGSYNKSYDSKDASVRIIHSVGIGTHSWSDNNRKNAHEIKFNGDHYIYGLGNFDGTNSADAQTLQEVINSKQEPITPGTGLEFEGNTLNVTLDTTVFKVVSALPDSPAQGDENKIHLIPAESTGTNNIYTEYVWVKSAWEILGEYTSAVDLTPYLKSADAANTYLSKTDAASTYATAANLTAHTSNTENPHNVTAAQVGLGNVDNTSDADKPISTATQEALNLKQNASDQSLQTTDKTIVGAINEIEESLDNYLTKAESSKLFTPFQTPFTPLEYKNQIIDWNQDDPSVIGAKINSGVYLLYDNSDIYTLRNGSYSDGYYWLGFYRIDPSGYYLYDIAMSGNKNCISYFYPFQRGPFDVNYSTPDSSFTGTTLINSSGISTVNIWKLPDEYSPQSDIYLVYSSDNNTTDKIKYTPVRNTKYQSFQTAHDGDKIRFDEIIQLSTIVTNSFAKSDLFIYHARINDEPQAKYYLVDIVMTE